MYANQMSSIPRFPQVMRQSIHASHEAYLVETDGARRCPSLPFEIYDPKIEQRCTYKFFLSIVVETLFSNSPCSAGPTNHALVLPVVRLRRCDYKPRQPDCTSVGRHAGEAFVGLHS
jgi:hypothetical protein